jgi:hypothetical protein
MTLRDLYIAELTMDRRVEEAVREARAHRQVRRLLSSRPGWLKRSGCHLMCRLGRLLMVAGARLVRAGLPPRAVPVKASP